jgi:hypothetical protein
MLLASSHLITVMTPAGLQRITCIKPCSAGNRVIIGYSVSVGNLIVIAYNSG